MSCHYNRHSEREVGHWQSIDTGTKPCEWLKVPNAITYSSLPHSDTKLVARLSKQSVDSINGKKNVFVQTPMSLD